MAKILICDDDKKILDIYSRLLTPEGFDVVECTNADHANEILKGGDIDLVLLDIKMPDVDGSEFHEVIQLFYERVKVIVTSVFSLDEQKKLIQDAFDYYDKSQGIDVLLEKIKNALEI